MTFLSTVIVARNSRLNTVLEIVLETARRLHFGHGMSIEEIDDTGILPRLRTTSAGWGAIWHGRMRCGWLDGVHMPADSEKRLYPVAGVVKVLVSSAPRSTATRKARPPDKAAGLPYFMVSQRRLHGSTLLASW